MINDNNLYLEQYSRGFQQLMHSALNRINRGFSLKAVQSGSFTSKSRNNFNSFTSSRKVKLRTKEMKTQPSLILSVVSPLNCLQPIRSSAQMRVSRSHNFMSGKVSESKKKEDETVTFVSEVLKKKEVSDSNYYKRLGKKNKYNVKIRSKPRITIRDQECSPWANSSEVDQFYEACDQG